MAEPERQLREAAAERSTEALFVPVDQHLRAWRRRERALLFGEVLLRALVATVSVWTLLLVAAWLGRARPEQLPLWSLIGGVAVAVACYRPLSDLRRTGELRRQAERAELLEPVLRGAMLTAFDRSARPLGSVTLLARVVRRAATVAAGLDPARVWPDEALRRAARGGGLVLGIFLVVAWAGPFSPFEVLSRLLVARGAAEAPPAPTDGRRVLVGDITLRYLYPTYTGLPPLEVPNSNGEIHAPPGTMVEIGGRAGAPFTDAKIQVGTAEPLAASSPESRRILGSILVNESGTWRFLLDGVPSADFLMVVEPDLPPDVTLAPLGVGATVVDRPLGVPWTARDDYGLMKLVVEVQVAGAAARTVMLREPAEHPRTLQGALDLSPRDLGIQQGKAARIRVGAWDNDEVAGSKVGWSAWVELDVRGADGSSARLVAWRRQLLDELIIVLADFLVDTSPPGDARAALNRWSLDAARRYEAVDLLFTEAGAGVLSAVDARMMERLNLARSALMTLSYSLGQGTGDLALADLSRLSELQAEHVEAVEETVLFLDQLVVRQAAADLASLMDDFAAEAQSLQAELGSLSQAAALARLSKLERLLEQLAQVSKAMRGQLAEWVNERGAELSGLMDEIRKAIAEGRMDDAQKMMDQLARQLAEMSANTKQMQEGQQSEDDALGKAMKKLADELEALQKEQEALRQQTESVREKDSNTQDVAAMWEQVEAHADAARARARAARAAATDGMASYRASLDGVVADADGLYDSARARDAEVAMRRAQQALPGLTMLSTQLRRLAAKGAGNSAASRRELDAAAAEVTKILELLAKMREQQQEASPETQEQLQALAEQQKALNEKIADAAEAAGSVAQQLPMKAPGLEEGAETAKSQGQRASSAMGEGDAMAAEGGQRGAEAGLQRARDALSEAQQNQRELSRTGRRSGGTKSEGAGGEEEGEEGRAGGDPADGTQSRPVPILLPAPEAFQTPEAYRRALLEGMEGEVPEEYRPLNRRYYEELVRQ